MDALNNPTYEYQVGGSLKINAPCYVWRQADENLYKSLQMGTFCYVFNCRQMGKSSLRVQVMQRLKAEGVSCAAIDLTTIGSGEITADKWYRGLILELHRIFKLSKQVNLKTWLVDTEQLPPVQQLLLYLEEIVLVRVSGERIVIFIDEIDSILRLNFKTSDFFALIRACYNQRADNPAYERLTFVLLGVATPADLVQDAQQTPFNIGRAIALGGLEFEKSTILAEGLVGKAENPQQVLQEILRWTGGQPFLTQKLCQIVRNQAGAVIQTGEEADKVQQLVQAQILDNWEFQDDPQHLRTIRDRLLNNEQKAGRLLGLYQQILEQGEISADGSPEQVDLQLTGLVVKRGDKLEVYNLIYRKVFNRNWVEEKLTQLRPPFYGEAIKAWLISQKRDESYLLRGQALQDLLAWAASRSLSEQDSQFLTASQELDRRQAQLEKLEAEVALEIEIKNKEVAEQDNIHLNRVYKKARLIIAISLVFAVSSFCLADISIKQQNQTEKVAQLEQSSRHLSTLFRVRELQILISAMQDVETLKKLVNSDRSIQNYPTLSPLYTLQQILDKIHLRNEFSSQQGEIKGIAFARNSEQIVSSGTDGTVRVWDFSGKQLTQWQAHDRDSLNYLTISSDAQQLATAGSDGKVRLWNLAGKPLGEWMAHSLGGVNYLSFSSDARIVATAGGDGMIRLWNLSGKQLAQWKAVDGESDGVRKVVISPNGRQIISVGDDGIGKLWNMSGQNLAQFKPLQTKGISSVSFSPDGKLIVTAETLSKKDNTGGIVRLWNVSGKQLEQWDAHQGKITDISFSPNGQKILTIGGDDFRVKLWNLSGTAISDLQGHNSGVIGANFSNNSQYLISADKGSFIRLWDFSDKSVLSLQVNQNDLNDVDFSPDGQKIVTVGDDGMLRIWMISGKMVYQEKRRGKLERVSFSLDGRRIAAIGDYNIIRLWNSIGQPTHLLTVDNGSITSVSFSPDGRSIATTGSDETAKIWSLTGQQKLVLKGHRGTVWDVDFSKDGELIATAGEDGTVRLWNLSGKERVKLSGHQGKVRNVRFSPDSKNIVTAGDDGIVRIWDIQGKFKAEFNTYQLKINDLSFSPDGESIATAGIDRTVRLWDLHGRQFNEFQGKGLLFWGVNFSPDGQYLAGVEGGGTLYLWHVGSVDRLLDSGCKWLKYYQNYQPKSRNDLNVCQEKE